MFFYFVFLWAVLPALICIATLFKVSIFCHLHMLTFLSTWNIWIRLLLYTALLRWWTYPAPRSPERANRRFPKSKEHFLYTDFFLNSFRGGSPLFPKTLAASGCFRIPIEKCNGIPVFQFSSITGALCKPSSGYAQKLFSLYVGHYPDQGISIVDLIFSQSDHSLKQQAGEYDRSHAQHYQA